MTTCRTKLFAAFLCLTLVATAKAQISNNLASPFVDPCCFDPDYQFFAPIDCNFVKEPSRNCGLFASADALYIYVTRPEGDLRVPDATPLNIFDPGNSFRESWDETNADSTLGYRLDLGFFQPEGARGDGQGWMINFMHLNGPNAAHVVRTPRMDRFNEDDADLDGMGDVEPVFPIQDRNDPEFMQRDLLVTNSINDAKYTNFELNKYWRLEPLHDGGLLEPFMGFKYVQFRDRTTRMDYARFDDMGLLILPGDMVIQGDAVTEKIFRQESEWSNMMFGGVLGMRYSQRANRWNLATEVRAFALQNIQSFYQRDRTLNVLMDGVGTGSETTTERILETVRARNDSEFTFGFDIRADAAYNVTRDLAVKFGTQVIGYPKGIARGRNAFLNAEDLYMLGFNLGVEYNR